MGNRVLKVAKSVIFFKNTFTILDRRNSKVLFFQKNTCNCRHIATLDQLMMDENKYIFTIIDLEFWVNFFWTVWVGWKWLRVMSRWNYIILKALLEMSLKTKKSEKPFVSNFFLLRFLYTKLPSCSLGRRSTQF